MAKPKFTKRGVKMVHDDESMDMDDMPMRGKKKKKGKSKK